MLQYILKNQSKLGTVLNKEICPAITLQEKYIIFEKKNILKTKFHLFDNILNIFFTIVRIRRK